MTKPRVKAGKSPHGVEARRHAFVAAYIANGHNATDAAIKAGFSPKTAHVQGCRLLTHVKTKELLASMTARVQAKAELTAENILREIARIALFDPARLFHEDGTLRSINDLDDDTRAAIASFEADELRSGDKVVGTTRKLKLWDKNAALEKAMRHLGLFEKDNKQRLPVSVEIELMG